MSFPTCFQSKEIKLAVIWRNFSARRKMFDIFRVSHSVFKSELSTRPDCTPGRTPDSKCMENSIFFPINSPKQQSSPKPGLFQITFLYQLQAWILPKLQRTLVENPWNLAQNARNSVKSNESIEFAVFRILQEKRKTTGAWYYAICQLFLHWLDGFKYAFLD